MNADPILRVDGLTKDFGGIRAVNGISVDLGAGESLGIIGPNGSGKTTLINLITAFVRPSAGRVIFKDKRIDGTRPEKIARMGLVRTFQIARPFYQLPAYKNVIVTLFSPRIRRLAGGNLGDRDAVAIDLLEDVGFERDSAVPLKPASILPHGYLKRLELAHCLALRPEVIILDELFSGLSLAEVAGIVPVIEKVKAQGISLIMIEHRLRELFRIVDRIVALNFGQKIADGSPEEVMSNRAVKEAYLGSE